MISQLINKIKKANTAYRSGKPIISDAQYDILIDELSTLDPDNDLLSEVGHIIEDESRKRKLPIEMGSMNKVKTLEEIFDWCRLKGINTNQEVIITPKFDGISLCVNELTQEAFTRGDGQFGQKSDDHYKLIKNHLKLKATDILFTYGEAMIPKKIFLSKYSEDFANPRNLVGGLLNSKDINQSLKDVYYIKYGITTTDSTATGIFNYKSELIDWLNKNQEVQVNYELAKISELDEKYLIRLFKEWSIEFEIDGVIIEINDLKLQKKLGRENRSNNPVWARAFKSPQFEQTTESEVIGISWNISKQGYLKPTIHIKPVKLDGVTISNVTGNNARFVKDMGIGIGAIVKVKRSGMVIPLITDVIKPVKFTVPNIPNIDWNENQIELITLTETDDQKLKQLISFFEILEAKNVSDGVITQLWNAGYQNVRDILNLTTSDMEKIERFGKRKASIVFNSIQNCIQNVELSKLQHATGIFKNMGSKKLNLLENFTEKPVIQKVMEFEGIGEILATEYVNNYDRFFDFIKDLPITISEKVKVVKTGTDLDGKQFVFTGVRRKDLEESIVSRGGVIGGSVSKNTTHLVCVDKSSSSSKMKKAIDIGIQILDVKDLENLLSL